MKKCDLLCSPQLVSHSLRSPEIRPQFANVSIKSVQFPRASAQLKNLGETHDPVPTKAISGRSFRTLPVLSNARPGQARANLLERRLVESHATVIIPFDDRVIFVSYQNESRTDPAPPRIGGFRGVQFRSAAPRLIVNADLYVHPSSRSPLEVLRRWEFWLSSFLVQPVPSQAE